MLTVVLALTARSTGRNTIEKTLLSIAGIRGAIAAIALNETGQDIEVKTSQLYELEAKLQNAEQLRREIEIKQRKYCGLDHIFVNGTMEEKKMLLAIIIRRIEIGRRYEFNIQLAPGFEQFLNGLIETRSFFAPNSAQRL